MANKRMRPARVRKASAVIGNGLKAPAPLSPLEQKYWDETVLMAPNLKQADTIMAFTWTRFAAAYASNPKGTPLSRIKHMNAIGTKLGFAPTARTRMGKKAQHPAPTPPPAKKRFRFDYFNDGSGGDV